MFRRACIAIFCLVATSAITHGENFWYALDGQVVPLIPSADRIAVRTGDPAAPGRIAGARAEAFGIPGWSIVTLDAAARAADTRTRIAAVLADPAITFATPVFDGPLGPGPLLVTDAILVRFHPSADRAAQDAAFAPIPGLIVVARDFGGIDGLARIRIESRDALDALDAANLLAGDPRIAFAEPDFLFTATTSGLPDDPGFPDQWALHNTGQAGGTPGIDIGLVDALAIDPGSAGVVVVVLDTGIDTAHPDLSLDPGADFTTDPAPGDGGPANACDMHGTWVAGCIAATTNNALGIAGGAGACRVASARIGISVNPACDLTWTGQFSWTVNALDWAQSIGARVTNNSNAYNSGSASIRTKYEELRTAGIIHFAAAGNAGAASLAYPASLDAVRAVSAIDRTGALASFSNFGAGLAYAAPGVDILSTDRIGAAGLDPTDYFEVDGTSFASPYAASAAALVASLKPSLNAEDIEHVLDFSATDLGTPGYDTTFGHGLIDAPGALALAACYDSWSPTGVSGPQPRTDHALAHDSARGVTVLFGGASGSGPLGDTWEHNGIAWSPRAIGGPSARSDHALAYDSVRGVTVLFGGFDGAADSGETWEYDGTAWSLVSISGPSARSGHAMVFDTVRGVTVLFGGSTSGVPSDETWEWDGAAWTQVVIAGPSPRADHAMAFDAARDQVVLFGGTTGAQETWVYEGPAGIDPGEWTLGTTSGPVARQRAAMAFDTRTQTCVLFGGLAGATPVADSWEWNGASWRVRSLSGPIARSRHAMVFRESAQDSFAFGGIDTFSLRLGDSWTWFLPAPTIIEGPDNSFFLSGETVQLTVDASAMGIPTYKWQRDAIDLVDGGSISGANTDTLTITGASVADDGIYTVVITDPCGASTSTGALVAIACAADINLDGSTNAADFTILAASFGTPSGATRAQGDLTGDGAVNAADFVILAGDFGCQAAN